MLARRLLVIIMILLAALVIGQGREAKAEGVGSKYQVFLPMISQGRPAPVTRYILMGAVYADLNSNGQQDADEPGIAGIPVEMTSVPAKPGPDPTSGSLTLLTNAEGRYSLTMFEDGIYAVSVQHDTTQWTTTTPSRIEFRGSASPGAFSVGLRAR